MKTSLTSIGVEGNRWLSRKGSDSGSGYHTLPENREVDMLPGTLSQNTIYSNASIRTDISGKAKTQFILPDVSGDYRIIAFANTKDSHFASSERILSVSKNYLIETTAPTLLRSGDISELSVRVSNHTKKITGATLTAFIGMGSSRIKKSVDVTLNPDESLSRTFPLLSTSLWKDLVPYTIELRENNILLDSSTGSFQFVPISELDTTHREVILFTGTTLRYTLPKVGSGIESASSKVSIRIAPTYYTPEFENSLTSLMPNPHGSIEEVIGSTLSNLLILSSSDTLNISMDPQ